MFEMNAMQCTNATAPPRRAKINGSGVSCGLFRALAVLTLVVPLAPLAHADGERGAQWQSRDRIERQVQRDRGERRDSRERDLSRAQAEQRGSTRWYRDDRRDYRHSDRRDHGHYNRHYPRYRPAYPSYGSGYYPEYAPWASLHYGSGLQYFVYEDRRFQSHPKFDRYDPFVRDEYGNCYRVEYEGEQRILTQVRNKYCRWD